MRKLARFFNGIARLIWRHLPGTCENCGAIVGMDSVISSGKFLCWPCRDWETKRGLNDG